MYDASGCVRVTCRVFDSLIAEARAQPNTECCGLLAGDSNVVSVILRARNALASATAYELAPEDLFSLFRCMRDSGLNHLGIYHSHPRTENTPSSRDIELAFYPDLAYFILTPAPQAARPVRAFRITNGHASELTIELV